MRVGKGFAEGWDGGGRGRNRESALDKFCTSLRPACRFTACRVMIRRTRRPLPSRPLSLRPSPPVTPSVIMHHGGYLFQSAPTGDGGSTSSVLGRGAPLPLSLRPRNEWACVIVCAPAKGCSPRCRGAGPEGHTADREPEALRGPVSSLSPMPSSAES